MCKKLQGVGASIFVEAAEDGEDDPIDALGIGEDHHGPSAASHFHETSFAGVGSAQLAPEMPRELIEVEQLGQRARSTALSKNTRRLPIARRGVRPPLRHPA